MFLGGCWAQRQLRNGIRYVLMPGIFMKLPEWLRGVSGDAMSEVPGGAMCEVMPVFRYTTRIRKFNRRLFKCTLNIVTQVSHRRG